MMLNITNNIGNKLNVEFDNRVYICSTTAQNQQYRNSSKRFKEGSEISEELQSKNHTAKVLTSEEFKRC